MIGKDLSCKNIYSICNEFDQRKELLLKRSTWADKQYWFNNGLSFYVIIVYSFHHILSSFICPTTIVLCFLGNCVCSLFVALVFVDYDYRFNNKQDTQKDKICKSLRSLCHSLIREASYRQQELQGTKIYTPHLMQYATERQFLHFNTSQ